MSQSLFSNRLVRLLTDSDFRLIRPYLVPVDLPVLLPLVRSNVPLEHIVFPEQGVVSAVAGASYGRRAEVGVYGRDGMSGGSLLLGSDQTPIDHYMQIAGHGHRVASSHFNEAVEHSQTMRQLLLQFVYVFSTQTAEAARANGTATIEVRIARWLLMCHDRVDGNEIVLTHKSLSLMLGVRRSGVTDILNKLEGLNLIRANRGNIVILDRHGLRALAGDFYGVAEAEYERLLGARNQAASARTHLSMPKS